MLDEVEVCEKVEKMKQFNILTSIMDTGLITSIVTNKSQSKTKAKQIKKEQHEELLEQVRKEGKEDFLWKNANTSGIQGTNAI